MADKTLEAVLKFKDEMSKGIQLSRKELQQLQKEAYIVNKIMSRGQSDAKQYGDEFSKMKKDVKGAGDEIEKTGNKMKKLKKTVLGVSSVIGTFSSAIVGTAVKDAISFESAFTGVLKTVSNEDKSPLSDAQIDKLRRSILNMTTELPKTAEELSEIAETAGQLGVKVNDIEKFTKVVAQLSDATDIQGADGAMKLAQFMNVMQMNMQDIDRLGAVITHLGNNSATTESQILNMASRISRSSSLLGISASEVMGIATAMSSVGIAAEMGGSAFSKMAINMKNSITKGGESLEQFAKVAGMTSEQFAESFNTNAAQTIGKFLEGLGTSSNPYAILDEMEIKEVRLRETMLSLSKTHQEYNKYLGYSNDAWRENKALTEEAERRYGTTASELAIMKNQIRLASIEIGTALLPLVRDGAEAIAKLASTFNSLSPGTKEAISKMLLLGAVIGFVAPIIALLCNPIGLVVLALIALNGFVLWLRNAWETNWNGMGDKARAFCDKVKGYWDNLKNWFLENPIVAFISEQWNKATGKSKKGGGRNAFGSGRIARNDELRRLHEGEKVLTKGEADRYERGLGGYGDVKVYVNGLTVREEADIDRIANALAVKIRNRRMTLGGVRV